MTKKLEKQAHFFSFDGDQRSQRSRASEEVILNLSAPEETILSLLAPLIVTFFPKDELGREARIFRAMLATLRFKACYSKN